MNTNFEKEISNKLYNSESTPPDGMFDNIMAKRANDAKAPFITGTIKSIIVGVVLISSVLIYFQLNKNDIKPPQALSNETLNQDENKGIVSEIAKSDAFAKDNKLSVKEQNTSLKKNVKSNANSMASTSISNNKNAFDIVKNEKSVIVEKSMPTKQDKNKSTYFVEKYKNILKDNSISSENVYQSYFDASSNIKPVITFEQHKGKSHLYQYESMDESIIDKSDINFFFTNKMNKLKVKNAPEEIALLKTKKLDVPRKLKSPLFVDFTVMPMLTFHHAFGNSSMLSDYHQLEKNTFNQLFEVRVSKALKNNISIYSGIAYTQLNQHYQGQLTKVNHVIEYVNRTIYINDPITGVRQEIVTDKLEYDKEVKSNFDFKNKYQVIQLPVGMSYNFGYKNFDFAINTGMNFNVINALIGNNLNSNSDGIVAYSSSKKSLNIGANFGIMTAYPLNYKFKLVFEPHVNMFGINAIKFGSHINPNNLNLGAKLGLRYTVF